MINYKPDGVTLFYIDASGAEVSANPLNGDRYFAMLQIRENQQEAATENTAAIADYHTKLDAYQQNVDSGRGAGTVPPPKPQMKNVSDPTATAPNGVTTYVDFVPPLPDPKAPAVITPNVPGGKNPNPPQDRIDVMLSIMLLVNSKCDKILAALATKS